MASEPMLRPEALAANAPPLPPGFLPSQLPEGVLLGGNVIPFPPSSGNTRKRPALDFERLCTIAEVVTDALLIFAATALPLHAAGHWCDARSCGLALGFAALTVTSLHRDGAYSPGSSLLRVRETERVLRAWAQTLFLFLPVNIFLAHGTPFAALLLMVFAVPLLLVLAKNALYSMVSKLHSQGFGLRKVVIYGAGMTGKRIFSALKRSPKLGLDPVAFIDDDPACANSTVYEAAYTRKRGAPVLCGPVTPDKLRRLGASMMIVGIPGISQGKLNVTAQAASAASCQLCVAPFDFASGIGNVERTNVDGTLLVILQRQENGSDQVKTAMDFVLSAILLVLFAPAFLLIAAAVRLDSAGPVLFSQERLGKNGARFRMYKFRSMYTAARTYEYSPAELTDPRITRVGRFLRKSSLDELPQLLNVLKGEMSLVGPRPEMPFIVEQYQPIHRQRLLVKPGITGLWQLSADRAYRIHENLEYDLYYIRNRNCFMDFAVLLHTIVFAARGI